MADIGDMLRETRMRERIDISEIEAQTKIRAKYLRALENEEWDLLPGPTFVKTFLRTYAEALGLDAKTLVNEYKLRFEHPGDLDLQPIRPTGRRDAPRTRDYSRPSLRWLGGGVLVVALIAVLYVLGSKGSPKPTPVASIPTTTPTTPVVVHHHRTPRAALQILPLNSVTVCLTTAAGTKLINGRTLLATSPAPFYRSSVFLMTVSNGGVRLRVDGHLSTLPVGFTTVGYKITRKGRTTLSPAHWPKCA